MMPWEGESVDREGEGPDGQDKSLDVGTVFLFWLSFFCFFLTIYEGSVLFLSLSKEKKESLDP